MPRVSLQDAKFHINRTASWLQFNRRVLEEAEDERNPLLERVRFLAITASNLDEFFEIRVSSLLQRIEDGATDTGPDGLSPDEEAQLVSRETHAFTDAQYRCWNQQLRPALDEQGISVLGLADLDDQARSFVNDYCERELDPLLTPVTIDPAHPFPRVLNKALCQALLLRRRRRAASSPTYLGVITVPRALPRLVRLPQRNGGAEYIFLADLVALHAANMYRGYEILSEASFRITRNSNLYVHEEASRNLLESLRTELHNRRKGDAVRLEIDSDATAEIVDRLKTNFGLRDWQVYCTAGPVNLSRLMHLHSETDRPDLKYRAFAPREVRLSPKSRDIFDELRRRNILLHHPFDSFEAVTSFIEQAAEDPRVLSIKQTLYRTDNDSAIVQALVDAAQRKEVTAVIELKARFDEAPNIRWARRLEEAGVQVFHGLVGLKTHCKLALIARKEDGGKIRRYAHLGTGNYNAVTSALYTDMSFLTADENVTAAVNGVFNFLTAYTDDPTYDPLVVAPLDLGNQVLRWIQREADHARHDRPARIIIKVNSLLDKAIIEELYRASQAGVSIDLIVRGVCGLRPGMRGISTRIRVRSVVGRFLEHSRIFYFANGGEEEIHLGSADLMPRNLYERVEVLFPIHNAAQRNRILNEVLAAYLADTAKARVLHPDGSYTRVADRRKHAVSFDAQNFFIGLAEGHASADAIPQHTLSKPKRAPKPKRAIAS